MPMPERVGVYPGTFDPVTNGHLDVIQRAARLLDRLVIGVAMNAGKGPIFPIEERVSWSVPKPAPSPAAPAPRSRWFPLRVCW